MHLGCVNGVMIAIEGMRGVNKYSETLLKLVHRTAWLGREAMIQQKIQQSAITTKAPPR